MRVFGNGRQSWTQLKKVGDTQSPAAHKGNMNSQEKGVTLWRPTIFRRVREWLLFSDLQINQEQEQQNPVEKEPSSVIAEITSCKHKSHTEGGTGVEQGWKKPRRGRGLRAG